MRRAIYAGSFDPLTNGHLWMIEQGILLFDELIVAVGLNPDKRSTFTLDERLNMLGVVAAGQDKIKVDYFENDYLVRFAESKKVSFILRGIRSTTDFNYEQGMRHINADINPKISSIFLIPPREISEVSSSLVRGLVGPKGWEDVVKKYVPSPVFDALKERV